MTANETPAPAFQIRAWFDYHGGVTAPQNVDIRMQTATREEADAIAALFPKSVKVHGWTLTIYGADGIRKEHYVGFDASFRSNKSTGVANETSIKRYRSFLRNAAKHGLDHEFVNVPFAGRAASNQYPDHELFESAIA